MKPKKWVPIGWDLTAYWEERAERRKSYVVASVVILHTEVVDYQDKQDGARDMAEKARGGGFMKAKRRQQSYDAHVAQLT